MEECYVHPGFCRCTAHATRNMSAPEFACHELDYADYSSLHEAENLGVGVLVRIYAAGGR